MAGWGRGRLKSDVRIYEFHWQVVPNGMYQQCKWKLMICKWKLMAVGTHLSALVLYCSDG